MSDKRSVATDALDTLGMLIDDKQKRDAIHLAVEPVIAGQPLQPGNHIRVENGVAYRTATGQGLGIVDPFLTTSVRKGDRFWFVMYPRTIQSLRHVWSHPAFPDEAGISSPDVAVSETWLRNFLSSGDYPDYETVMEIIDKGSISSPDKRYYENGGEYNEDYILIRGSDAHGTIPLEFWDHVEIVLGRKLKYKPEYFSCSC